MLHPHNSTPLATSEGRESRLRALMDQMRPAAEQALRQMAEELLDAPDAQLFGDVELRLRDHAHQLAATVHQTGLAGRKKGGAAVAAAPAPTASARRRIEYDRENLHRVDYPAYRAKGWDVGSGPTAAGCKVLQGRLKGTGMRWGVAGSEQVGALKALYASGEGLWDAFWTQPQRPAA